MSSKKIRVLYDTTPVCNILQKNAYRSGIFFASYNILLQLQKQEDLEIYLYAEDLGKLKKVIETYPEFYNSRIYNFSYLVPMLSYFSLNKLKAKEKNNAISAGINGIIYKILKYVEPYFYKKNLKDIDVYFSSMKAVPKFVAGKEHIKKYTVLHDTIPLVNDLRNVKHGWFNKLVNSINKNDFYFANSEYTKQDFIKYVPAINAENITVIPLSTGKPYCKIQDIEEINKVKQKYNIPLDKKYIFSLCNLDPRKNLIFSMKNFLKFVEKNKIDDFVFVMGGKPFKDFAKVFNENIDNLGELKNKILQIGYVDDEDMSALYSGAEMFLFPSLYEGFGMPILEAMKCGLPVICSNCTSIPEVIGDCGIQINPYSDDEMIAALEKMYYDKEFRSQCIEKAFERAKMFTWEKCVSIICEKIKDNR